MKYVLIGPNDTMWRKSRIDGAPLGFTEAAPDNQVSLINRDVAFKAASILLKDYGIRTSMVGETDPRVIDAVGVDNQSSIPFYVNTI
jgi:hypothetical protein